MHHTRMHSTKIYPQKCNKRNKEEEYILLIEFQSYVESRITEHNILVSSPHV